MLTLLLDENLDGFGEYLARFFYSTTWSEVSTSLQVGILTLEQAGLAKGSTDVQIWELCQAQSYFLVTDNRNDDRPDSLESMIRTRNLPTSLPIFTIADTQRLRSHREYAETVVAKLLEYLMDADNIRGAGRLYVP